MKATYLDTVTGRTAEEDRTGIAVNAFLWGNWSCDCNRRMCFPEVDEPDGDGYVCASSRFIVIAAELETEDQEGEEGWLKLPSLFDLNQDYPPELLAKHGIHRPVAQAQEVRVQEG